MPFYMYQAAYTPESVAAQIKDPHDRFETVRSAFGAMGDKIVFSGYPSGEDTCWPSSKPPMTRLRPALRLP